MAEWLERLAKAIPKNPRENLLSRLWLRAKANDQGFQLAMKEMCKRDILFWVNLFVWTYDPRRDHKSIPFITYDFQDESLLEIQKAIHDQEPLVIPKSRDMGASWMVMLAFDHMATFERDCQFFVLSRKGDLVDKKSNRNSLFWKIDFVHKMLPAWLCPEIERPQKGERTKMAINYLESNSAITGGTTTKAAEVGGRATAGCVDEFSRYEAAAAATVKSGLTGDVADCVIWPFTRNPEMGKLHPCQELVDQGNRGDIRALPLHWTRHPRKVKGRYNVDPGTRRIDIIDKDYDFSTYKFQLDGRFTYHSEWFDRYRKKKGNDREVSVNLEFDDDINDHLVYDPIMIKEYIAQHVRDPDLVGDLEYDELTGEVKGFIPKVGGPIKLWMPLDIRDKPPEAPYVAAADISLGVGTTNSCFTAARSDTGEMILEFTTPFMKPDQFAVKCVAICNWLNSNAHRTLLCWEAQGPGETFGNKVIELGYHPLWRRKPDVFKGVARFSGDRPGFSPQQHRLLHTSYEAALRNRKFINHSKLSLEETLQFEHTPLGPKHKADRNRKNDPSGATVNHGDRCIPAAICAYLIQERGIVEAKAEEKIPPGSLAHFMRERQAKDARSKTLFPNWNKQRRFV